MEPTPNFNSGGLRHPYWVGKVKFQWSGVRASKTSSPVTIYPDMSSDMSSKVEPTPNFNSEGLRQPYLVKKKKFQWSGVRASNSSSPVTIYPDMSSWQSLKWNPHQISTQEVSGIPYRWEKWSFNGLVLGLQILAVQSPFILICLLDSLLSGTHTQFQLRRPQASLLGWKSEVSMFWC